MLSEVKKKTWGSKIQHWFWGGRGWGRQGKGISISTMQKGAILRKCVNTFVPHCRYVPPQRVLVLHHFGLKTGEDFAHFLFWSGLRYGFQRNYKSVWTFCRFNSKCSAIARLDLLGGQSRVPKTQAARGFLGACSSGRFWTISSLK